MKPHNFPRTPEHLWSTFYDFTQIPRPSKKEDKMLEYLIDIATKEGLQYKMDSARNIVIYVPGKNGRENDESVIIQNHVDMVTDSLSSTIIDFSTEP